MTKGPPGTRSMFSGAAAVGAATPEVIGSVDVPFAPAAPVLAVSIAAAVAVSFAVAVAVALRAALSVALPLAVAVSVPMDVGAGVATAETLCSGAFRPHPPDATDRTRIPSPTTRTIFTATVSV